MHYSYSITHKCHVKNGTAHFFTQDCGGHLGCHNLACSHAALLPCKCTFGGFYLMREWGACHMTHLGARPERCMSWFGAWKSWTVCYSDRKAELTQLFIPGISSYLASICEAPNLFFCEGQSKWVYEITVFPSVVRGISLALELGSRC